MFLDFKEYFILLISKELFFTHARSLKGWGDWTGRWTQTSVT